MSGKTKEQLAKEEATAAEEASAQATETAKQAAEALLKAVAAGNVPKQTLADAETINQYNSTVAGGRYKVGDQYLNANGEQVK